MLLRDSSVLVLPYLSLVNQSSSHPSYILGSSLYILSRSQRDICVTDLDHSSISLGGTRLSVCITALSSIFLAGPCTDVCAPNEYASSSGKLWKTFSKDHSAAIFWGTCRHLSLLRSGKNAMQFRLHISPWPCKLICISLNVAWMSSCTILELAKIEMVFSY